MPYNTHKGSLTHRIGGYIQNLFLPHKRGNKPWFAHLSKCVVSCVLTGIYAENNMPNGKNIDLSVNKSFVRFTMTDE